MRYPDGRLVTGHWQSAMPYHEETHMTDERTKILYNDGSCWLGRSWNGLPDGSGKMVDVHDVQTSCTFFRGRLTIALEVIVDEIIDDLCANVTKLAEVRRCIFDAAYLAVETSEAQSDTNETSALLSIAAEQDHAEADNDGEEQHETSNLMKVAQENVEEEVTVELAENLDDLKDGDGGKLMAVATAGE